MKTPFPFLLSLLFVCLFGFSACGDDDAQDDVIRETLLNYDGANVTAPTLNRGFNTFAAFFPASEVGAVSGRRLQGVRFWLSDFPNSTVVVVYEAGANERAPGRELYSVDLTQRIRNTGWYTHTIPAGQNIEIPESGIWLGVEVDLPADRFQSIGCDAGNNYSPNGDRLLPPSGNTWTSFNEITGSERINWNIRGIIAAE